MDNIKSNNMVRGTNIIFRLLMKAMTFLTALTVVSTVRTQVRSTLAFGLGGSNLNVGSILLGDRLLHRSYVHKAPTPHSIQIEDVVYRGPPEVKITAIQAQEVEQTQYGRVMVISGGLKQNNATVRFISARGWGYYYVLEIYGFDDGNPMHFKIDIKNKFI